MSPCFGNSYLLYQNLEIIKLPTDAFLFVLQFVMKRVSSVVEMGHAFLPHLLVMEKMTVAKDWMNRIVKVWGFLKISSASIV